METLRTNQRTLARSLGTTAGRMDTRDVKKGLAVVPFRHSKLTEILMDYFVGEGKAVSYKIIHSNVRPNLRVSGHDREREPV